MSEELGSGPYLDGSFDFRVDPVGDIEGSSGASELEKDLSIFMSIELQQYLGSPPRGNTEAKVKSSVIDVAESDSRIRQVPEDSVNINISPSGEDISASLIAQVSGGEEELVFNI